MPMNWTKLCIAAAGRCPGANLDRYKRCRRPHRVAGSCPLRRWSAGEKFLWCIGSARGLPVTQSCTSTGRTAWAGWSRIKDIPAYLLDETDIAFHIDMSHAIAMKNHLQVNLTLHGKDVNGAPYNDQESAGADFIAQPPFTGWKDYEILMWQPYPANLIPELKQLGVNGATYSSRNIALPDFLIDTNTRWYSESLATDFYSEYHRWRPDRAVGWSFIQAKKLYQEHPDSLMAFKRHPSFWDPYWRKLIHDRGVATAERLAPYRPYFYSLADESGIADLAALLGLRFLRRIAGADAPLAARALRQPAGAE